MSPRDACPAALAPALELCPGFPALPRLEPRGEQLSRGSWLPAGLSRGASGRGEAAGRWRFSAGRAPLRPGDPRAPETPTSPLPPLGWRWLPAAVAFLRPPRPPVGQVPASVTGLKRLERFLFLSGTGLHLF